MAVTQNKIIAPQGFNQGGLSFAAGDTTAPKILITAGANGTIVQGISAWSNDTATINAVLSILLGGNTFRLGTVRIVTLTGQDGAVNSVSLLNTIACPWLKQDAAGNPVLELKSGAVLQVGCLAAMTAAKLFEVYGWGLDL